MEIVNFEDHFHYSVPTIGQAAGPVSPVLSGADQAASTDAALEAHSEQLLRFDSEFHRQLFQDFLAEAVDDHPYRVLRAEPTLPAIEQLVLADFHCRPPMLDPRPTVPHLHTSHPI